MERKAPKNNEKFSVYFDQSLQYSITPTKIKKYSLKGLEKVTNSKFEMFSKFEGCLIDRKLGFIKVFKINPKNGNSTFQDVRLPTGCNNCWDMCQS